MRPFRDYKKDLLKEVKNPQEAVGYLNAALEESDPRVFLLALRDVLEAQGGLSHVAKKCRVTAPVSIA
jgi:DNA-binding phage protein